MANVSPPDARIVPAAVPAPALPPPGPPSGGKRAFAWGLALAALVFVVTVVPVRDRCDDPRAPVATAGTKAAASPCRAMRGGASFIVPRGTPGSRRPSAISSRASRVSSRRSEARASGCSSGLLLALFFATLVMGGALAGAAHAGQGPYRSTRGLAYHARGPGRRNHAARAESVAMRCAWASSRAKGADLPTVIAAVLARSRHRARDLCRPRCRVAAATTLDGVPCPKLLLVLAAIPVAFVVGLLLLRWKPLAQAPFLVRGRLAQLARPVLEYVGEPGAPRAILTGVAISLVVSADPARDRFAGSSSRSARCPARSSGSTSVPRCRSSSAPSRAAGRVGDERRGLRRTSSAKRGSLRLPRWP